ncbi:cysteine desulfurase family protein [Solimonas terrae]|uniref:cysteine desulfurase n=1 Tax=Solimonas terrae TaxID=1396819 RepID=A0A6M2BTB4_9GAMM|nr:cysteine desulfurase family protein [Solimonas terrae]NGY05902.1 cysteine desulfurase [Solimonas terrae]
MPIYLDGHATTPIAPEARDAMMAAWHRVGNAGSPHSAGLHASVSVDAGRAAVAKLIGADASEVVFTSGATEANNIAILGVAGRMGSADRPRIVVSAIEHKAVLEPARSLRSKGFDVVEAPVDRQGRIDLDVLRTLIDDRTLLVSIMAANNETGVLQPVAEVAAIARKTGALIHCDAAQAVGKLPLDVFELDVDYLSLSAHKLYGPLGVGALYVSAAAPRPNALVFGGGQEGGLRAGTLPAPLCVGFGVAAELAARRLAADAIHVHGLSERFLRGLKARHVSFSLTGGGAERLPGSTSLMVEGIDGEQLVDKLGRDLHISTGSACNSGQIQPSHVLRAMGLSSTEMKSSVRILFGRYNSTEDAEAAAGLFAAACAA